MDLVLPILLFAFTASITPGPNNIMIMASGLNFGTVRSLPHLFGICLGFPVMVILIGMGLGVVFEQFPILHSIIKVVGVIYLLYLAWRIANAEKSAQKNTPGKPLTFIQSALFQWVNPKGWIMATSAIAAYTTVSADIFLQVLLIAFIFFLVTFPSAGSWLVFGVGLKRFLDQPEYRRIFNICMAVLLVLSIIPVALDLL